MCQSHRRQLGLIPVRLSPSDPPPTSKNRPRRAAAGDTARQHIFPRTTTTRMQTLDIESGGAAPAKPTRPSPRSTAVSGGGGGSAPPPPPSGRPWAFRARWRWCSSSRLPTSSSPSPAPRPRPRAGSSPRRRKVSRSVCRLSSERLYVCMYMRDATGFQAGQSFEGPR